MATPVVTNGVNTEAGTATLSSTDFSDTRDILDIIDKLRSQGISKYVDLPQIIVCGEQSSGKSSVLEALSGMTFPTKDAVCTRFATELILRGSQSRSLNISIVPGNDDSENRTDGELEKLRNFEFSECTWPIDLSQVVEEAKAAMGVREGGKTFSSDILRVELSGPDQPHLTLVDLPGLYQAGSKSQTDADSEVVKSLVLSYMHNPRSIILAVVSAKNDFNNQSITSHARRIDKIGQRTLGLITKPDTLHSGSDSERFYLRLAQNAEVKFELGWHVLRNRDFPEMGMSLDERKEMERAFFSRGVWASVHPSQLGLEALKPRLSKVLKDHIVSQLPSVIKQIEDGIVECEDNLRHLGAARGSIREQRRYLLDVSSAFSSRLKDAINGTYIHQFFGSAALGEGYRKRLRAVIQNTLTDFASEMRIRGHTYAIEDSNSRSFQAMDRSSKHPKPEQISRDKYLRKVTDLLRMSRGRELPGLFDPLIVGELFHEQCQPWKQLVAEYVRIIIDATYFVLHEILEDTSDGHTKEGILSHIIYPSMEKLKLDLQQKVDEVMKPHLERHPITYNHYLTDTVQKVQANRREKQLKDVLEDHLGGISDSNTSPATLLPVKKGVLLRDLTSNVEVNMEKYSSETATDFMEAYYKVAQKNVVDALSTTAIEECLVQKLPGLFCVESVVDLDENVIQAIAAEDPASAAERIRSLEKLAVLEKGLRELRGLQKFQPIRVLTKSLSLMSVNGSEEQLDSTGNGGMEIFGRPLSPTISTRHASRAGIPEIPQYTIKTESLPAEIAPPEPAATEQSSEPVDDWGFGSTASKKKKGKKGGWRSNITFDPEASV